MIIELDELLTLAGRLDDIPGFDTPRERFRRFLTDHVSDVTLARSLIETCQRSVGEQRHRALQDLVVLLGRFLHFEMAFGAYEAGDSAPVHGRWRSRSGLEVILDLRTDQTPEATLNGLAHAVSASAEATSSNSYTCVGLCVVARHYTARARLERAIAVDRPSPGVSIVSVDSLLVLAAHVASGRLTHADVLKLLKAAVSLDVIVELLDRPSAGSDPEPRAAEPMREPAPLLADRHEPGFWVATIGGKGAPEQVVASMIAQRRVLGVSQIDAPQRDAAPGDWVCFFIREKGIVGHAQLASVVENGASVVRDGALCSRVFQLDHIEIYAEPVVNGVGARWPFAVPTWDAALAGPCLTPVARRDFLTLTKDQSPRLDVVED